MIGPRSCRRRLDALHHLEKARKRYLFRRLAERLEFGGAILVADIIATSSQFARPSCESQWDELARQQSMTGMGSFNGYERAIGEGWRPTWLMEKEEGEMRYPVSEQLKWLEEAGFSMVDCFWLRAGHAIYGGYR
jgi:tRNA (cmo5U34)-methyltransferase